MYVHRRQLGAASPSDIANAIMPQSQISKVPGFTSDVWADIEASAQSGNIQGFTQSCTGASGPGTAQLVNSGAGIGLSIAGAVATGPLAPLVLAGEAIVGIFSAIFAEHARAVAKEQQVECAAVPSFNSSIEAIANAVNSGTITPQQGIASLSQLLTEFQTTISQIMKNDSSQCNAGCVWYKCAQAAVAELQSQYEDLVSQSAASSAGTSTGALTSSATSTASSWLPIAAIVAVGIFLATEL